MSRTPFRSLVIGHTIVLTMITASCDWTEVYTVETRVTEDGAVVSTPRVRTVRNIRRDSEASGPRARVHHTVHDFGMMDPLTIGKHGFLIKNVGDEPLQLRQGPTTCKCTLSQLTRDGLQPGDETVILLTWNSGRDPAYKHHATILTNDPGNRAIRLTIKGTVRTLFGCRPEQLVFPKVMPGETPTATALVYSQVWNDMEVLPVESSVEGVRWQVEKASVEERHALEAQSAYRLSVTLSADLEPGYFMIPVHLEGSPQSSEAAKPAKCELIVSGRVLRAIGVYGSAIDSTGTIRFGRIWEGSAARVRLLVKVRDDDKHLRVRKWDVRPDFLKTRLEPYKKGGSGGLYHLIVEVPKDAPTFRLPPDQHGELRMELDHPRIRNLHLKVDLVILPRQPSELLGSTSS